ncbi:1-aminocyclopropane-1-carboxylate oxidase homolog 6-like [Salvia miltiorrhiza]|uniref:1-aminocyclopropane-1-carboxylate oxidase homolog 6-like n=1 Tax=Salvia miltiorrhiza TaxID=226208 RepID=UPI0025AD5DB7|nr:1-aminocyclopropane-1-carboxylate oxidase homolog 6-like [Salvia miltiorrhiza]
MGKNDDNDYDWDKEVAEFEKSKGGVKGLVDSGITKVPRFFISPPEPDAEAAPRPDAPIPTIDLEGVRAETIGEIRSASRTWGFFQVVNHGIPAAVMDAVLRGTRGLHEQPKEAKQGLYTSDGSADVRFYTINARLEEGNAASWRDAFACKFTDGAIDPELVPPVCRDEIMEYMKHMVKVRDVLSELLSEALGARKELLAEMQCMESEYLTCLYYPASPEPDKSLGTVEHSDPTVLTVLLQDDTGGLQIKHDGRWIDVPPVPGALIVNIGDFLQLMSNDKLMSVEHRVLCRSRGSRVSVACFFFPRAQQMTNIYGPIKQVVSPNNPALYKQVNYIDFVTHYQKRSSRGGHSALANYKLIDSLVNLS